MQEPPGVPSSSGFEQVVTSPGLLVGAPRSGTSWLQRMLLDHPACCGGHESHFLVSVAPLARDHIRKAQMHRPHGLAAYLTREELLDGIRDLWRRTVRETILQRPGATLLLEKTPDHAVHLELARELFPACRVVHLVRDARAVVDSLIRAGKSDWGREWAPGSIDSASQRWVECVEAAEASGRQFETGRYLRVHYEQLRLDPFGTLGRVLDHFGLDSDPDVRRRMIEHNDLDRARTNTATAIPMRGMLKDHASDEPAGFTGNGEIDGWKKAFSRRELARIWSLTGDTMQAVGYDRDGLLNPPTPGSIES